ncbi:MAG: NFACT family protein [Euryarchaeota archaeon]|nr:NFACT family protein [Euryarchaeota archaeon]MBU4548074.1 NFACT family protein [Euryarchaeota archaeon]MBV1755341.1 NFACT family protein [Methanobacterium sp.]MBV1767196.1 NFACT family protein [Methanobacterium sp.]
MKKMSNVDIYAVCHELNDLLVGSRVDKAYQPTKDTIIIRFHVKGKGRVDVVFQAGVRMHTSQYPMENPKLPPNFPMMLRKYIKGGMVNQVKQHNFDRVVEIKISKEEEYTLIVELFAKGNIILLNKDNNIILPLKRKLWSDRQISSKEEYKFPPDRGINPLKLEKTELREMFSKSDSDLIRTLARNGLGGIYAEEIIERSKLDKSITAAEISESELDTLYESILNLFEPLINHDFKPHIVSGGKEDVLPLELEIYENSTKTYFDTYNEASDEFFSTKVRKEIKGVQEELWAGKVNKYAKRLRIQEETLEKFEKTIESSTIKGDLIYAHYALVEKLISVVLEARNKYSWAEIRKILKEGKKKGLQEAQVVESIDKMGTMVLNIEKEKVMVDPLKSIPENAEIYYEKAKKAKRKIKGVLVAIEKTKEKLVKVEKKKDLALENIMVPQKRVKKDLKWFEKLRWFLSSDGNLVIGGRDAHTNEIVVKKHLENNDIYLHSDIHGAPSVVIKKNQEEISEQTLQESGEFAASFSSAWSKGFGSQDVYWVKPDQVSKTPQSGEFVAKGAFIIRGSRNYIRGAALMVAVGVVDYQGERIMAGPVSAVKKHTDNYVILKPGYGKKEAVAKEILSKIDENKNFKLEDVIQVLPSGKCDIVTLKKY